MKNFLKENKAITLIALVITIVVLIILAIVAINFSLGNNGIFNRAKTAKEQYSNSQGSEEIEISKTTNQIDSYVNASRENIMVDKDEYEKLVKNVNPFTWELNTEINLGNGVYGYRIQKASFSIPGTVEFVPASLNAGKIIDWGGSFVHYNGNMWALPAATSDMGNAEIFRNGSTNTTAYNLQFTKSGTGGTATNLDAWVKYIK